MRFARMTTALLVAGALASVSAHAALSDEAAAVSAATPLYLPASPSDPGGLKGYDHASQLEVGVEADAVGKNKKEKDKKNAKKPPLKAVKGPKVKAGSYALTPAPGAEPD